MGGGIVSRSGGFVEAWRNETMWCVQDRLTGGPYVSRIGVQGKLQS